MYEDRPQGVVTFIFSPNLHFRANLPVLGLSSWFISVFCVLLASIVCYCGAFRALAEVFCV